MDRSSRFRGMVVAFDTSSRELVGITVSGGRVTSRVLRTARAARATGARSNVVELSSRRRSTSRAIS
jgi:xanthine/CO dehydrogenase XdhC/CoxF family maturation factor